MPAPVVLDQTHWANHGCQAWWAAWRDLTAGLTWLDLNGRYPFTFTKNAGTDSRANIVWSPSLGTNATILGSCTFRPGALANAFVGPFTWASTTWYGASSFDILAACPTAGTLSFWHRPSVASGSVGTTEFLFQAANSSQFFQVGTFSGGLYAGFYTGTEYRANYTIGSDWSTGSWSHYVATWRAGDKTRIYVNGQLGATAGTTNAGTLPAVGGTFTLGSLSVGYGIGSFSTSGFDDIGVWNYQMSDSQVWSIYEQSLRGWPGRISKDPSWWNILRPAFNAFSNTGTGGMFLGGYPVRTSAWIMPGTGGMADGGKVATPTLAFVPAPAGGMNDGGDTAAPLAWDTFAGSSGVLLTAHASDDGGAWTKHTNYSSGDARLDGSGAVYSTVTSDGVFLHSHVPASADYTVSCDCTYVTSGVGASQIGPGVRWSSGANTGYFAQADQTSGGIIRLYKVVSGSLTSLGTSGQSWTTGQTRRLSLSAIGTSLRVYWNGSLVIGPVTDSSISSAGQAALYARNAGVSADNWMSTGGGVQARYYLTGAGGEALGGKSGYIQFFVQSCAGGVSQGGKLTPSLSCKPTVAGGMAQGASSLAHLLIVEIAAGGMVDGGAPAIASGVVMTGGMADGGAIASAIVAFHPAPVGGMKDGGQAAVASVFIAHATGGLRFGGTIIMAGLRYHVYGNDGAGGPIDYTTILSTVFTLTWTSGTLTGPGVWSYGVRPYDGDSHLENLNVDAVVTVRLDASSHDITRIPDPPLSLMGHAASGGVVVLNWHYNLIDPARVPTQFRIYQGVGTVSYTSPVGTISYTGSRIYSARLVGLTGGTTYLFGVRAANSTGEEANTGSVSVVAETVGPSAVINVSVSAVA